MSRTSLTRAGEGIGPLVEVIMKRLSFSVQVSVIWVSGPDSGRQWPREGGLPLTFHTSLSLAAKSLSSQRRATSRRAAPIGGRWGRGGVGAGVGKHKFSTEGQKRTNWLFSSVGFWLVLPQLSPASIPFLKEWAGLFVPDLTLPGYIRSGTSGCGGVTPYHDLAQFLWAFKDP